MARRGAPALTEGWQTRLRWCVLALGADTALQFLRVWRAWQLDARRPQMLHFVALGELHRGPAQIDDDLSDLSTQLADRLWGLTPGMHRLVFEAGRVLLTLGIGEADAMLRAQRFEADAIWLGGAGCAAVWNAHHVKALARRCRHGTRVVAVGLSQPVRELLARSGFAPAAPGPRPSDDGWSAVYEPSWTPRAQRRQEPIEPASGKAPGRPADSAVVIGAGLAGAAVAASLARRGFHVRVLDAAPAPAGGASSLPAGLFVPHLSADDALLSRLSRAGIRETLQFARRRLERGVDWRPTGVLEVRADAARALGPGRDEASRHWSRLATPRRKSAAGLDASIAAVWHRRAGWMRPAALVRALLAEGGARIEFCGGVNVARLARGGDGWRALDADGAVLAEARLIVVAAGSASRALLAGGSLPLQPVRGQLSIGSMPSSARGVVGARFPLNGHGSFAPCVPLEAGFGWIAGATYERDRVQRDVRGADHAANLERLRRLAPAIAETLAPEFDGARVRGWAGVRCTAPDRLPVVGRASPGLWIASALGSRGLSLALLCAELLAARLLGEPLPVEPRLADALDACRFGRGCTHVA